MFVFLVFVTQFFLRLWARSIVHSLRAVEPLENGFFTTSTLKATGVQQLQTKKTDCG